jgi:glycosyltransferase involved in cell wall biosynthesis
MADRGVAPKRTRVLVTGPDIAQKGGAGIQQHVRYLLEAFEADASIEIVPFAITTVVREEPWALKGARLLWKYLQLLFVTLGMDVVHINTTIDNRSIIRDSGVAWIAGLYRRPVVLQFHGGDVSNLSLVGSGRLYGFARRALRRASAVLFLSEVQGEPVRTLYGLDPERVKIVANYVPVGPTVSHVRPPADDLRVLFLGRLHETKGVLEAIEAFRRVARPEWRMRVAGAGPAETAVRAALADLQGAEFCGFVQGDEKQTLLEWADVFVLPSSHFEGMPYGALEALANGLAVVASANAGLASLVRDGWNGIVVPPLGTVEIAAALESLARNRVLLGEMQLHSRELAVREFSLERGREVFSAIYGRLAQEVSG